MKNIHLLIGTIFGSLAIVFGIAFLFSRSVAPVTVDGAQLLEGARHSQTTLVTPDPKATATQSATASDSAKTRIQIVEFSDFQCPACKVAQPLKDELLRSYPDQIEFYFRHYPLRQIHPLAQLAAQAAEAAADSGKFWEMHDKLFETQTEWENLSEEDARKKFSDFAKELGIKPEEFAQKIDAETIKNAIQQDINVGDSVRVDATPTFFVNGKKVSASDVLSTVQEQLK